MATAIRRKPSRMLSDAYFELWNAGMLLQEGSPPQSELVGRSLAKAVRALNKTVKQLEAEGLPERTQAEIDQAREIRRYSPCLRMWTLVERDRLERVADDLIDVCEKVLALLGRPAAPAGVGLQGGCLVIDRIDGAIERGERYVVRDPRDQGVL